MGIIYTIKLTETVRKYILVEADTAEEARKRARDGYGRSVEYPKYETYTEIVDIGNPDKQYKKLEESYKKP